MYLFDCFTYLAPRPSSTAITRLNGIAFLYIGAQNFSQPFVQYIFFEECFTYCHAIRLAELFVFCVQKSNGVFQVYLEIHSQSSSVTCCYAWTVWQKVMCRSFLRVQNQHKYSRSFMWLCLGHTKRWPVGTLTCQSWTIVWNVSAWISCGLTSRLIGLCALANTILSM